MSLATFGPAAEEIYADDPLPDEPWTELGYAHRLVYVYGGRLRYIGAWQRWLVWDGTRWTTDATGQPPRWAKIIARRMTTAALAIADEKERAAAYRLARRGEASASIAGVLKLASTEEAVSVTPDQLDADPYLLNVANGTLDLRTMELRKHDPDDLLTKIAKAAYRPGTTGTEWAKFLERVQPEESMRGFLARLTGLALEGRVAEHLLPIHYGKGANGKGTFFGAIMAALGDYADAADPDLLTARTFDAHPTGVADLFGLRLAVLHEGDAGRRLAEGTVKRLTGGDRLKARRMRENFWSFDPSHTFSVLTNHKPIVGGRDEGIWRRIRLVPWDVVIPAEERDDKLGDRLAMEADAVLVWLVDGYQAWRENGLADPDSVTKVTKEYREESDALARFIEERCLIGPHFHVRSSQLFAEWSSWSVGEGVDPGTNKSFTNDLTDKGFDPPRRSNTGMVWRGITVAHTDGSEPK